MRRTCVSWFPKPSRRGPGGRVFTGGCPSGPTGEERWEEGGARAAESVSLLLASGWFLVVLPQEEAGDPRLCLLGKDRPGQSRSLLGGASSTVLCAWQPLSLAVTGGPVGLWHSWSQLPRAGRPARLPASCLVFVWAFCSVLSQYLWNSPPRRGLRMVQSSGWCWIGRRWLLPKSVVNLSLLGPHCWTPRQRKHLGSSEH